MGGWLCAVADERCESDCKSCHRAFRGALAHLAALTDGLEAECSVDARTFRCTSVELILAVSLCFASLGVALSNPCVASVKLRHVDEARSHACGSVLGPVVLLAFVDSAGFPQHVDRPLPATSGSPLPRPSLSTSPAQEVVRAYLSRIGRLRREAGFHPKMVAVAEQVALTLEQGEKVLLFYDHIATAQELAIFLSERLPHIPTKGVPSIKMCQRAWSGAFAKWDGDENPALRETFMRWLCSDLVRAQTWDWICANAMPARLSPQRLELALEDCVARSPICARTILSEAKHLYALAKLPGCCGRALLKCASDFRAPSPRGFGERYPGSHM
ncbi:hypothetical protein ACVMII_003902 [Bradyrhizobium diazoefficiens]